MTIPSQPPTPIQVQAADMALSLLFRKLHPHLEDTAHALSKSAPKPELERLHLKLLRAREATAAALEAEALKLPQGDDLRDSLETLASDLMPIGEVFKESLTLVQLCLEDAPAELLPYLTEEAVASAKWAPRLATFFEHLEDPAYQTEERWKAVDDEIGETTEFDEG